MYIHSTTRKRKRENITTLDKRNRGRIMTQDYVCWLPVDKETREIGDR
jgi:hypothetical protein